MQFVRHAKLSVPRKLEASFEKVRRAIERDDFYSANLKKLGVADFFRVKLDYDSRLLVRFVEFGGKRACLALELIEHHAYDRSRFLRGARVDASAVATLPAAGEPEVLGALGKVRYLHPERSEFHFLDKPLSFDDRQDELLRVPLPMVLVGCAGSGKTALTLTKLRELPGDVLYVTQSPYLVENAQNLYFSHGYENEAQNVEFLSYRALLESVEVPKGRAVTLQDFRGFFRRHEQSLRFTSAHQLFEELRGVLGAQAEGPLSLEAYLALGVRQSIYPLEQRKLVHGAFAKYQAFLAESGFYDTNLVAHLYKPRVEARYDALVVDEVQDLTNAELSLLLRMLRKPRGFLLCGDANQIVHPNFFSWSSVKRLFYCEEEAALRAPVHVLEANYRSSHVVCRVANELLMLKNARFGSIDRESTALVRAATDRPGKLLGLIKKDAVLRELNQRTRSSAEVAVIVLDDEKKVEARQKFSTPLVFSIHEAKGLEYEAVILYDLISTERTRFREITEGVTRADLEVDGLTYSRAKDKGDKSLEVYKFFVNALYVALTRAVDTIYIVETDANHRLLELLQIECADDLSQVTAKQSSLEDWQKEARRLELQGKDEQAQLIRNNVLRLSPVPWPVIDDKELRDTHQKALAPRSIFNKAKQRLYEFAAFHGLGTLAFALRREAGYVPPKPFDELAVALRERSMSHYANDRQKVLLEVSRYGLEHRSMLGMTPLMMATDAGNLPLVETLLERGARSDAVDSLGRMPVHFAVRRAFHEREFARDKLGPLFSMLCPSSIDIEVDDKRSRLTRAQGEFLLLLLMVARIHELYTGTQRYRGFQTRHVEAELLHDFPASVIPEERRRRVYWNGVFARAEVSSTYRPARKLWRRAAQGHYLPSSVGVRVAGGEGKPDLYVPLDRLLGLDLLEQAPSGASEEVRSNAAKLAIRSE